MSLRGGAAALIVAILTAVPGARAASFDSLAPRGAPAHWLPPEPWVYSHWLPFDEQRLYRLLEIDRGDLWRHLRDDRRTVAALARAHGHGDMRRLAAQLVSPRARSVAPRKLATLRRRALRLLTQGHLAQHVFFHSLHQFAIPSAAPWIFGVSDHEFRALRRGELSPLAIGALHGRSVASIHARSLSVLRGRARAGVRGGDTSPRQARLLLRRQVSQLPRWLGQQRYNGPPLTEGEQLVALPRDYAGNPSLSADGATVVFEAYRQQLDAAVTLGEIAVIRRDLRGGGSPLAEVPRPPSVTSTGPELVNPVIEPSRREDARPTSAYNPTVSGDGGAIAYEAAPGNNNFAKRYGRIGIFLRVGDNAPRKVDRPPAGAPFSQSAYNPRLAAEGGHLAFQAVRDGGRAGLYLHDVRAGATQLVAGSLPDLGSRFSDVYEPAVSADGRRVAYTLVAGRIGRGRTTSRVLVRDMALGRTVAGTRAGEAASAPALSPDGRWLAYVARRELRLRELATGREHVVPAPAGTPLDPQVAGNGGAVAFTLVRRGGGSQVHVYDRAAGSTEIVSRGDGRAGAVGDGAAAEPSISSDGRVVAFASSATNLDPAKSDDTRGVFVRDRAAETTVLASAPSAVPARRLADAPPLRLRRVRGAARRVAVLDNQFGTGRAAPTVRVRPGSRVAWQWRGRDSHSVTVVGAGSRWRSRTKARGVFARRLQRPGSYRVFCRLHAPGMRMTVAVG